MPKVTKKVIKKKKKVWKLNQENSSVFRALFSINKVIWNEFKDMCDESEKKYSKEVERFMLEELKRYYNGNFDKIVHLDQIK